MCCLFGILDYGGKLSRKEKTKILSVLSVACEERGTDATGIAYNTGGSLKVYKRPLPAHLLWFRIFEDTNVVMGHTRMTTQGSERFNANNHPFTGQAEDTAFALAHNGVLSNDKRLRRPSRNRFPQRDLLGQLSADFSDLSDDLHHTMRFAGRSIKADVSGRYSVIPSVGISVLQELCVVLAPDLFSQERVEQG